MKNTANTKQNHPTIPQEVSKKLVESFPPDTAGSGIRVSQETAAAISEALRLFLVDAHHRASIEVGTNGRWLFFPQAILFHPNSTYRTVARLSDRRCFFPNCNKKAECDDECAFEDDKNKASSVDAPTSINANHVTRITGDLLMDYS
mmetsp:Transcript_15232/g.31477  ORF Transcript_15232/g.31477 Transcript_15232/m.31477 type:complete len:147 (-) Transcript_15232:1554-1994(-)